MTTTMEMLFFSVLFFACCNLYADSATSTSGKPDQVTDVPFIPSVSPSENSSQAGSPSSTNNNQKQKIADTNVTESSVGNDNNSSEPVNGPKSTAESNKTESAGIATTLRPEMITQSTRQNNTTVKATTKVEQNLPTVNATKEPGENQPTVNATLEGGLNQPTVKTTKKVEQNLTTVKATKEPGENQPNVKATLEPEQNQPTVKTTTKVEQNLPTVKATKEPGENQPNVKATLEPGLNQPTVKTTKKVEQNLPTVKATKEPGENQPNVKATLEPGLNQPNVITQKESEQNQPIENSKQNTVGGDGRKPIRSGSSYSHSDDTGGHFMAYFMTFVVICIAGYIMYHNKQKILAFLLEGRKETGSRRRPSSKEYKRLKTEEVMPSLEKNTSDSKYIY